jgi:DNA-binding NtrC family response regulator
MPEMDGLETLKHLRAEPDPPQVIIITGNGTVETAINAMKLGAYDYMAKPYRMAEIDACSTCLEASARAREPYLQARLSRVDSTPEVITQYAPMHAVLALLSRV